MRSLCISKTSRNNELRALPCWSLKLLNGSEKNLIFEGMVPSVSCPPGKCVFNVVTESRHCLQMSVRSGEVLKAGGHCPMRLRLGQGSRLWESRVASPVWFLRKFMGAQGMSPAWLGNAGSSFSSLFSFETLQHSVLVSLLHRGTLISV